MQQYYFLIMSWFNILKPLFQNSVLSHLNLYIFIETFVIVKNSNCF